MKFYCEKGKNATRYRSISTCGTKLVRSGNSIDVKDAVRSGRPITEKTDEIMEKIEQNRHVGSRDIGKGLNVDHKTVLNHLEKTGYKKRARCLGAE